MRILNYVIYNKNSHCVTLIKINYPIQQQQQQTNKSIKNQNKIGDVTARILARVNRHMNTTPIPTNHDTPDINLPKANNKTNNQTEHKQNNKETIENKNIQ